MTGICEFSLPVLIDFLMTFFILLAVIFPVFKILKNLSLLSKVEVILENIEIKALKFPISIILQISQDSKSI